METDAAGDQRRLRAVALLVRRHWVFSILLLVGAALRALVQATYWPAMWNADSANYVRAARTFWVDAVRPSGYGFAMHFVPGWSQLWPVTVVQHVLVLVLAVGLYATLLRWNLPRWAAALAAAPLLLDPLQAALENFILSDVPAEILIVTACLALAWSRRIRVREAAVAGAVLGLAATVRTVAAPLVVLAVVAVLLGAARRRRALVALMAAFVIPFGAYVWDYHRAHGAYNTTSWGSRFLYGRIGLYVDCNKVTLPDYEQALCPVGVAIKDRTTNLFLWQEDAYLHRYVPPPGKDFDAVVGDFDKRVITQQPLTYARVVLRDSLRVFLPSRVIASDNLFDRQWELSDYQWKNLVAGEFVRLQAQGLKPRLNKGTARLAADYENVFVTPGPLLALCLVAALAAVAGVRRARRQYAARIAVGLAVTVALALIVIPAATASFSWRYEAALLPLLPFAAALGLSAMMGRLPEPAPATEPTPEPAADPAAAPGADPTPAPAEGADPAAEPPGP